MRLVLDTNVLVAALRSPKGASAALLAAGRARRFVWVANLALFLEYEAVLTRPEHRAPGALALGDVFRALDAIADLIELAEGAWRDRPQLRDPDDEMVLEAAVNGRADAIVTFETRTFTEAASRLGIRVLTPAASYAMVPR